MTHRDEKTRYDRIIVEDSYRSDAIGQFVRSVVRKERAFKGIDHGGPGLVFCRLQDHASRLAQAVGRALDCRVPVVTSRMSKADRDKLVARMRARDPDLPVVVACMVWSTGIDIPPLEWVLWAGEGQAPIWLKQASGRGTRLDNDKSGFVVFDWQTVGPETEVYQEQAARRAQHYEDGGFKPPAKPRRQQAKAPAVQDADVEVELLEKLLTKPSPLNPGSSAVQMVKPLPDARDEDDWDEPAELAELAEPAEPNAAPRQKHGLFDGLELDPRYKEDPWFWLWPWVVGLGILAICIYLFC